MKATNDFKVTDACSTIVIRQSGRSTTVVAQVLGRSESGGTLTLWLDRLVHRPTDTEMGDWDVSGAVTTILSRRVPATSGSSPP